MRLVRSVYTPTRSSRYLAKLMMADRFRSSRFGSGFIKSRIEPNEETPQVESSSDLRHSRCVRERAAARKLDWARAGLTMRAAS